MNRVETTIYQIAPVNKCIHFQERLKTKTVTYRHTKRKFYTLITIIFTAFATTFMILTASLLQLKSTSTVLPLLDMEDLLLK